MERLLRFLALLARWNRVYNLTAVQDPERAVAYHVLDSLSLLPYLHGRRFLDLGSGAGFPGVPVALAEPEKHCTLLDSRHKPVSFLRHAQALLPLNNVAVEQARVQNYRAAPFDSLLVRGYGPLERILRDSAHLISPDTRVLAMKAKYPEEELRALQEGYALCGVYPLEVPAVQAPRHLVVLRREEEGEAACT